MQFRNKHIKIKYLIWILVPKYTMLNMNNFNPNVYYIHKFFTYSLPFKFKYFSWFSNNIAQYLFLTENSCKNPRGQEGSCINIKQCAELIEMLRSQRQQPGVADFLRASACGFEGRDPKVCCASEAPSNTNVNPRVAIPDEKECGFVDPDVKEIKVVGGYPAPLGESFLPSNIYLSYIALGFYLQLNVKCLFVFSFCLFFLNVQINRNAHSSVCY